MTARELAAALEEVDNLREDLHRVTNACDTISALAEQLGSAIGWDTPGDTWVDKALFLKAFYVQRSSKPNH